MMSTRKTCRGAWGCRHPVREVSSQHPRSLGIVPLTAQDRPTLLWKNRCSEVKVEVEDVNSRVVTKREIEEERHREDFMCHTNTRQYKRILREKVATALKVDECVLERRRHQLRCLLAEEDASNLRQISEMEVKAEDRAAQMRDRLKELRNRKEEERVRLVQAKLMQQLLSQNDSLRAKQSDLLTQRVAQDRLVQMKEKELRREAAKEEERIWAELKCADTQARTCKEEVVEWTRREKAKSVASTLRQQIEEKESKRMKDEEKKKKEQQDRLDLVALMQLQHEEELRERQREKEALKQVYERGIRERQAVLGRELLEEDTFDLGHLERLFTGQSEQAKQQQQRKIELLREQHLYREYVMRKRRDQERLEMEKDRLCAAEVERANREKDEEMRKREEISDQLLRDCVRNHLKQMNDKEERKARAVEAGCRQVEARLEREKKEALIGAEETKREKQNRFRYGSDLISQVHYSDRLRDEESRELKRMFCKGLEAEAELERKTREITEKFAIGKLHPRLRREIDLKGALPEVKITKLAPTLRRDRLIAPCAYLGKPNDDAVTSFCKKVVAIIPPSYDKCTGSRDSDPLRDAADSECDDAGRAAASRVPAMEGTAAAAAEACAAEAENICCI